VPGKTISLPTYSIYLITHLLINFQCAVYCPRKWAKCIQYKENKRWKWLGSNNINRSSKERRHLFLNNVPKCVKHFLQLRHSNWFREKLKPETRKNINKNRAPAIPHHETSDWNSQSMKTTFCLSFSDLLLRFGV
jgi:hypothetical protein